ncbi:MAG: hypothetical protein ACXV8M_08410 [Candidatus Angelobacter sp.]
MTITKAITIDGGGQVASVLVSGTNGIVVSANASTDVVILRNLRIAGIGSGLNGIQFLSGKALGIENCAIFGFTQNGINIASTGGACLDHEYGCEQQHRARSLGGIERRHDGEHRSCALRVE